MKSVRYLFLVSIVVLCAVGFSSWAPAGLIQGIEYAVTEVQLKLTPPEQDPNIDGYLYLSYDAQGNLASALASDLSLLPVPFGAGPKQHNLAVRPHSWRGNLY